MGPFGGAPVGCRADDGGVGGGSGNCAGPDCDGRALSSVGSRFGETAAEGDGARRGGSCGSGRGSGRDGSGGRGGAWMAGLKGRFISW